MSELEKQPEKREELKVDLNTCFGVACKVIREGGLQEKFQAELLKAARNVEAQRNARR